VAVERLDILVDGVVADHQPQRHLPFVIALEQAVERLAQPRMQPAERLARFVDQGGAELAENLAVEQADEPLLAGSEPLAAQVAEDLEPVLDRRVAGPGDARRSGHRSHKRDSTAGTPAAFMRH
jgi:hypothetical protein